MAMSRIGAGCAGWESEVLPSTQTDSAEPKAWCEGQPDEEKKRASSRRSRAKRNDASKDSDDGRIEGRHPLSLVDDDDQQTSSIRPGTMIYWETETTVATRDHDNDAEDRFLRKRKAASRGDRGRPSNVNFLRPHDRNRGSPAALPASAITLIVFGALFVVLGAAAIIFCCRASGQGREQSRRNGTVKQHAKSSSSDDDDAESMAPVSVRDLPITKVPELEGTPRTESRYGPLAPIVPELHGHHRPSEMR
ncbi:hypothetical protein PG994_014590 [Apiospora phragmitis]|uniref:Transmembrane protein n=1 Tax=Apiospora phragmitis TaxID=2905665 RepID=A0ABR1T781_9PEZI